MSTTTLGSIGFTVVTALGFGAVAWGCFGCALASQSPFVAPRAVARPKTVIYTNQKNNATQYRGNPWTGWIGWTLRLSYDTMLRGVPGTGTRCHGQYGRLLKVNLDGIVLLRFHHLSMKISAVAMILYLLVLIPIYSTAECRDNAQLVGCSGNGTVLTDYEQLTLANVPSEFAGNVISTQYETIRARLYSIVMVYWILVAYACYELREEWIQVLALRRVYYLEHDVWASRKAELKETLLYEETQQQQQHDNHNTEHHHEEEDKTNNNTPYLTRDQGEDHLIHRDPWIPHPEPRETVPNVALYSVLVGSLPALPNNQTIATLDEENNNHSSHARTKQEQRQMMLDWQLQMTVTFFDHCIPNQPGFSSSVAAVTIVPSARDLSNAWRKWYAAAAKLRRLRYIRQVIAQRRRYDIEVDLHHNPNNSNDNDEEETDDKNNDDTIYDMEEAKALYGNDFDMTRDPKHHSSDDNHYHVEESIYENPARFKDYYRAVLGILDENDDVYEFLRLGPEQAAVYSREFAQAAAPCCPRGCCQELLDKMTIDDLVDLEEEMAEEVHHANMELKKARRKAAAAAEESEYKLPPQLELSAAPNLAVLGRAWAAEGSRHQKQTHDKEHRRNRTSSVELGSMPSSLQLEAKLIRKHQQKEEAKKHKKAQLSGTPSDDEVYASSEENLDLEAGTSQLHKNKSTNEQTERNPEEWDQVVSLVQQSQMDAKPHQGSNRDPSQRRVVPDGRWRMPSFPSLRPRSKISRATEWTTSTSKSAVKSLASDSTFAVVTFTSRQSAVAARHCLSDGRGANRWIALEELPIPPLADAASFDVLACRNCCRPLALGVNERQKTLRKYAVYAMLGTMYSLYTIPLTAASEFFSSEVLNEIIPQLAKMSEQYGFEVSELLSGLIGASFFTIFFALCPVFFKAIANFGSKATSVCTAELHALRYYWYFMLFTAFSGQILARMTLSAFGEGDGVDVRNDFQSIVREVSQTIPSRVASQWLNWIIFRMLAVLPFQYLLQVNTFLFTALNMKCCARMVMGGGPGGPTPYRIYVDSGVVLMCCFALGPSSPLIGPVAWLYFVVCQPLLRRNLIFMYRPKYDGGGIRWPFIFDMIISSMVMGCVLLAGQMGLKDAFVPAVLAAVTIAPILMFQREMRSRYMKAFEDAALLQTSLLDGWNAEETSMRAREEFRRFLVDAHKAAYVPVCLAATDTDDSLTAEPALTISLDSDPDAPQQPEVTQSPFSHDSQPMTTEREDDDGQFFFPPTPNALSLDSARPDSTRPPLSNSGRIPLQRGATMRRVSMAGMNAPRTVPNLLGDDMSSQVSQSSLGSRSSLMSKNPMSSFTMPKQQSSSRRMKPIKSV